MTTILLPSIREDEGRLSYPAIARDVVRRLRKDISGALHDEILRALLVAECEDVQSRGQLTVNDMIDRLTY